MSPLTRLASATGTPGSRFFFMSKAVAISTSFAADVRRGEGHLDLVILRTNEQAGAPKIEPASKVFGGATGAMWTMRPSSEAHDALLVRIGLANLVRSDTLPDAWRG